MQQHDFDFRFKGERTYVHGTDMFNQTLGWLRDLGEAPQDIDFAFHRMATRQLSAVPGDVPEGVQPAAVCTYKSGGERRSVALVERDAAVTHRYAYPEDELVASMQVDLETRRGVLTGAQGFSDIEVLVAMTKALHLRVFSELQGRWLFARGRFPAYIERSDARERSVTIAASFNNKLTRSVAMADGVKVGEIFFALS